MSQKETKTLRKLRCGRCGDYFELEVTETVREEINLGDIVPHCENCEKKSKF